MAPAAPPEHPAHPQRPGQPQRPAQPQRHRYVPLLYRVAAINASLLVVAVGLTIVIVVPGDESSYRIDEEGILLVAALALVVVLNLVALGRPRAPRAPGAVVPPG